MATTENMEKGGEVVETGSDCVNVTKEIVNPLKTEPESTYKSIAQTSTQGKDAESCQQVKQLINRKRKRRLVRGKGTEGGQISAEVSRKESIDGKKNGDVRGKGTEDGQINAEVSREESIDGKKNGDVRGKGMEDGQINGEVSGKESNDGKKDADSASEHVASGEGTANSLRTEPQTTGKSIAQTSTQGKDAESGEQVKQLINQKSKRRSVRGKGTKDGQINAEISGKESIDGKGNGEVRGRESNDCKNDADSEHVASGEGTANSLKTESQNTGKSIAQTSTQIKDAETGQQVKGMTSNKRKRTKVMGNGAKDGKKIAEGRGRETKDSKKITEMASRQVVPEQGTVNSLKPETKGTKSVSQNSVPSGDAGTSRQVQVRNDNFRKRRRDREERTKDGGNKSRKHVISMEEKEGNLKLTEKQEETKHRDRRGKKKLGGLIFMCSSKTKPDCFRYRIMGVTRSKKELVLSIKPGLKLFLYDFDLKLMYGVYKASSPGGERLVPIAFNGGFPFQVRFEVEKDCIPLPESVFIKAIRESYNEKTRKFDTELTVEQVKRLSDLFRPAPHLTANVKTSTREHAIERSIQQPRAVMFSKEEAFREHAYRDHYSGREARGRAASLEYDGRQVLERYGSHSEVPSPHPVPRRERGYGGYDLQQGRHILPPVCPVGYEYGSGPERDQLQRNTAPVNGDAALDKGVGHPDPYFLTEAEYRTYGLRGSQALPTTAPALESNRALEDSSMQIWNPYDDSTTSLVNRYLSVPRTVETDVGSYPPAGESYRNDFNYTDERRGPPERAFVGRGMIYSSYDSRAPPDYDHRPLHLGGQPESLSTVSSRYSFGGPSISRR